MTEREAKIPVPALEPVAARLRAPGAASAGGGRERNAVFDTPAGDLARRGRLLRVRTVDGRPGGTLTVKGPAAGGTAFKAREEHETRVDDPEALRRALAALGYAVVRRYEKDRDEWTWAGARIALDRAPGLGAFVEAEGGEDAIRRALADLGLDAGAHVGDSYLALWDRFRAARGRPPGDMLFEPDGA